MYTDAHVHLYDFAHLAGMADSPRLPENMGLACASSHGEAEFLWQENLAGAFPGRICLSFGIHPQDPDPALLPFLETLARQKRIAALGECGFDRFTPEFKSTMDAQEEVWGAQVSIAQTYGLPLIVHCRKALDLIFRDARALGTLRAVVFHGWTGSLGEAQSLLNKGVNGYFCAGKALLRGDRSLIETLKGLSLDRILSETDAPWMKSKGEPYTKPGDIGLVLRALQELRILRGDDPATVEPLVEGNFKKIFAIP